MTAENREEVTDILICQIEMLLEALFMTGSEANPAHSQTEQLAIMVSLRKILGSSALLDLGKVHENTRIVTATKTMIKWINQMSDGDQEDISETD